MRWKMVRNINTKNKSKSGVLQALNEPCSVHFNSADTQIFNNNVDVIKNDPTAKKEENKFKLTLDPGPH